MRPVSRPLFSQDRRHRQERSENDNSISFTDIASRSSKCGCNIVERMDVIDSDSNRDELFAYDFGGGTARTRQSRDIPVVDARRHRSDHATNVLVGENAEHRDRAREKPHLTERSGQDARGMRVVRDIEHDRRSPRKHLEAAR